MQKIQGWVEQGNTQLLISGAAGTIARRVQGSYPLATVTVYNTGTVVLASIYADDITPPTPKANPFTSGSDGSWYFYAASGLYDVRFSGGGIPVPFTIGALGAVTPTVTDILGPCCVTACDYAGADIGAKINAALADLPVAGGIIDATSCTSGSFSTQIALNKPVELRLGDGTITYTGAGAAIKISSNNVSITGLGWGSVVKMGSAVPLLLIDTASFALIRDLSFDGASRGFAANAVQLGTGTNISNLLQFERVRFADIQGSALITGASAEIDDFEVIFSVFDNCGTATAPCIDLVGLTDTARFVCNQLEGFIGIGLRGSGNVQRVRVIGDKFHGDVPSNTNVAIDWNGYRSVFMGCQFNFIQGAEVVLCKNVDNAWIGNESTDPGTGTHGYVMQNSAHRNRISLNEISGPAAYTGAGVRLDAVGDCIITSNIIRNAGASASSYGIQEINVADRNQVFDNTCLNVGTVEAITGVNSLFSDNGALDSQALVRRTQKFATGDAGAPTVAGDVRIKRTGSNLGVVQFDDGTTMIVGYRTGTLEIYVSNTLRMTVNGTKLQLSGIYYDTTGAYRVNGTQVVGAQGASIPDITDTAGATYNAATQTMLGNLKNDVNAVLARLRAHGLIAP